MNQFRDEGELRNEIVKKISDLITPVLKSSTVDRNEMLSLVPQIDDIVKSAYNFVKDIEQFNDRPQNVPGWVLNGWSGPAEADHPTNRYSTLPDLHVREQINYLNTEVIHLSENIDEENKDIMEEIVRTIQERVRLLELLEIKEHRAHLANLLLSLYREIAGVLISKVNSPVFQSLKEHHNEIRFSMVFEAFLEDVGDMLLTAAHAWAQTVSGPLEWGLAETGPAPIYRYSEKSERVFRQTESKGLKSWVPEPNWDPAGQDDSNQWQTLEDTQTKSKSKESKEETILRIISPHLEGEPTLGEYTDLMPTVLDLIRNFQNPNTVQLVTVPTAHNFVDLAQSYAEEGDMDRAAKITTFLDIPQRALFIMDLKQLCLDLLSIIQNEQDNLAEQMIAEGTIQAITPELIKELRKAYDRYNEIAYEWANSMIPSPVNSPNKRQKVGAPPPFEEIMIPQQWAGTSPPYQGYNADQFSQLLQRDGAPPPFEEYNKDQWVGEPPHYGEYNIDQFSQQPAGAPPPFEEYDIDQFYDQWVGEPPHYGEYNIDQSSQQWAGEPPHYEGHDEMNDISQFLQTDLVIPDDQTAGAPPDFEHAPGYVPYYGPYTSFDSPYIPTSDLYFPGHETYIPDDAPSTSGHSSYSPGSGPYIAYDSPNSQGSGPNSPGSSGGVPHSPVDLHLGERDFDEEDYSSDYENFGVVRGSPTPPPTPQASPRSRSRSRSPNRPKPEPKSKEFVIDFDSDSDSE